LFSRGFEGEPPAYGTDSNRCLRPVHNPDADEATRGGGAVICPGVKVGSKSVIGAGSVVTRDIPDGVFAAGNPCRVLRQITE
jgi:hypothetical protein